MSNRLDADGQQWLSIRPLSADAYISYVREDESLARSLRDALEGQRFSVTDFDALRSRDTVQVVEDAITTAGIVIVLLSRRALASGWHRNEVNLAFATHESRCIIPIATEELDPSTLPYWLSERYWLHLHNSEQAGEVVGRLKPTLEEILGSRRDEVPNVAPIYGNAPMYVPLVGADSYVEDFNEFNSRLTVLVGPPGIGKTSLLRRLTRELREEIDFAYWIDVARTDAVSLARSVEFISDRLSSHSPTARALIAVDGLEAHPDASVDLIRMTYEIEDRLRFVFATRSLSGLDKLRYHRAALITLGQVRPEELFEHFQFVLPDFDASTLFDAERVVRSAGGSQLAFELCVQLLRNAPGIELDSTFDLDSLIDTFFRQLIDTLTDSQHDRLYQLAYCSALLPVIASHSSWMQAEDESLFARMRAWGVFKRRNAGIRFTHDRLVDYLRRKSPTSALESAAAYVRSHLPDPANPQAEYFLPGTAIFTQLPRLGWSSSLSRNLVDLAIWQALVWRSKGEYARAEQACNQASRIVADVGDTSHSIRVMNLEATLASDRGKLVQAQQIERRAADIALAEYGPNHPISIASMANIATTLRVMGDLPEAISILREVVAKYRAVLPEAHPELLAATANLAMNLRDAGLANEALQTLQRALEQVDSSWMRAQLDQVLAAILVDVDRLDEAAAILRNMLEQRADDRVVASSETLQVMASLAAVLDRQGDHKQAAALRKRVFAGLETLVGSEHPSTISARIAFALSLFNGGERGESLKLLEEAIAVQQRVLGADHPDTLQARAQLAGMLRNVGNDGTALELYESLLSDAVRVLGPDHIFSLRLREDYATQLARLGDKAGSQLAFRELYADLRRSLPPDHPMLLRVEAAARSA